MNNTQVLIQMNTHIWYELCFLRNMFTVLIGKVPEYVNVITPQDIETCRACAADAVTKAMEEFRDEIIKQANNPENVSVEWDRPEER